MDVKDEVLLQLFNTNKLRNGTKTYLKQFFLFIVKFKKLWFSAPLKGCIPIAFNRLNFTHNTNSL